jgi:hypothetical protein
MMQVDDYDCFVQRATDFLSDLRLDDVLAAVDPLEIRWHPNGFVVAYTSIHFEGVAARLHCWPAQNRIEVDGHPPIHNHVWHLCSKVLLGTYVEQLYELSPADPRSKRFEVYDVSYLDRTLSRISPSGQFVAATVSPPIEYSSGEFHQLRTGAWHATRLDVPLSAVTVMLRSKAMSGFPNLLDVPGRPRASSERTRCDLRTLLHHIAEISG